MKIKIYFDGASSNNGKENQIAGIGICVYKKTSEEDVFEKVYETYENIGSKTNNFAEWTALIKSLELIKKTQHKYNKYIICGDSKLVIEQFNNRWKIKDPYLKELYKKAKELEKEIHKEIEVVWIPRNENPADKLAKKAIKEKTRNI